MLKVESGSPEADLQRFNQKQNLQVNVGDSVSTPPSKGPPMDATPYMLVAIDMYVGLFLRGTGCPPIVQLQKIFKLL